jgi:aspartyl-tRNA(Asn)/glutamyl-tRNA(Gln) amidotransferase subunit A
MMFQTGKARLKHHFPGVIPLSASERGLGGEVNMNLTQLTLSEASDLLHQRQISPLEMTRACLERIELLDGRLHCFITLTAISALEQARQAEADIRKGKTGELRGIPLALKDMFETARVRTTAGSKIFTAFVPEKDAAAVEKLISAGAVMLGKLNLHEIALGVTNENPHYGDCLNPWDENHISGGSSGGAAAALAAGLCFGALGTDTGGSIRIPSSLCGVVGLKPTRGRVSLRGVIPLSWSLDHAGPMARRVRDVAILYKAIAGYDPGDPFSVKVPVKDVLTHLADGVQGWRVALARDSYFDDADADVLEAVQQAAVVFEGLGAQVSEVPFPGASEAAQFNALITQSEAAAFHHDRLASQPEDFGEDVLKRLRAGAAYTSFETILARAAQPVLRRQIERFFESYDILLTPTTPISAPLRGGDAVERARLLTRFTAPFNLTGLPALSLPCGFAKNGLPVGLQIVSRPWADAEVLRVGQAYEQSTEWHLRQPGL